MKAILVDVRERRKLRLEGRRTLNLDEKWGPRMKRLSDQDVPVEKFAVSTVELSKFQKSLNMDGEKSGKVLEESKTEERKLMRSSSFRRFGYVHELRRSSAPF